MTTNYAIAHKGSWNEYSVYETVREQGKSGGCKPSTVVLIPFQTPNHPSIIYTLFHSTIEKHMRDCRVYRVAIDGEGCVRFRSHLPQSHALSMLVYQLKGTYSNWHWVVFDPYSSEYQPSFTVFQQLKIAVPRKLRQPAILNNEMIQDAQLRFTSHPEKTKRRFEKEQGYINEMVANDRLVSTLKQAITQPVMRLEMLINGNQLDLLQIDFCLKEILKNENIILKIDPAIYFLLRANYLVYLEKATKFSQLPVSNQRDEISEIKKIISCGIYRYLLSYVYRFDENQRIASTQLSEVEKSWIVNGESAVGCEYTTKGVIRDGKPVRLFNEDVSFCQTVSFTYRGKHFPVVIAGVLDGHADLIGANKPSREAAELVRYQFANVWIQVLGEILSINQIELNDENLDWVLWDSFENTFRRLQSLCRRGDIGSGTTVSIALIFEDGLIYTVNAGDSRSCLLMQNMPPIALSEEGGFNRPRQKKWVEEMGAKVVFFDDLTYRPTYSGKGGSNCPNTGSGIGDRDRIPFKPTIYRKRLTNEEWGQAELFIACDGVFDRASMDDIDGLRKKLPQMPHLEFAEEIACRTAFLTKDNLTILMIKLASLNLKSPWRVVDAKLLHPLARQNLIPLGG